MTQIVTEEPRAALGTIPCGSRPLYKRAHKHTLSDSDRTNELFLYSDAPAHTRQTSSVRSSVRALNH